MIAWRKRRELYKPIVKPNEKNKSKQKLLHTTKLKTAISINQKRSYKEALSWAELSVPWLASSNSASSFRRLTYLVFKLFHFFQDMLMFLEQFCVFIDIFLAYLLELLNKHKQTNILIVKGSYPGAIS